MPRPSSRQHGFSLVELTVVLVIVALLSSGLLIGLGAQRDVAANQDAQRQLDAAREALLGFAMANGRLPCPADPALASGAANAGLEDRPNATSICNTHSPSHEPNHGVLPWATLALPETDPWGRRLTYFVATQFTAPLPTTGAQASFDLGSGVAPNNTGLANVTNHGGSTIAIELAAVVVSHGGNGLGGYPGSGTPLGGAAGSEAENADADLTFVVETPGPAFDDLLTWISPHLLKSRLVAAGKLP